MASIADVYITVLPETSKVADGIKRAFLAVDKDAREAGGRWKKEIEGQLKDVKVKVSADTAKAKAEIDSLDGKNVTVKVDVDRSSLDRVLGGGGGGGGGGLPGGGGAFKFNAGLVGIGLLPAAATALTNVAGAIQQLAGAGLVLPGVFAGIASSFGTAALGAHGMSDALKAITKASDGTKASVEAANTALAKLSPNAADTVKTVAGLKGTFDDLQHLDAQNLFAGFSEGLKGLVTNLLPATTRGIDGISRSLNQNLLQAMNSLGSGSSQGFLSRIFGNTANAQGQLTSAIDPIIHAFGTLASIGSDSLPRLATAVGNVADRFDKFITTAAGDGNLQKWISQGIDGFTSLGNIALNIGKTFTALTQAAGGGAGLLGTLEQATQKLQLFLNSSAGQQTLIGFFAQGRDMLGQLRDVAVQLGPILSGVFQSGLSSANLWLPVIRQILSMINSIPGGAQAVVTAFVAWKTISGVASLASSLGNIAKLLQVVLPGAATTGAAGITASFTTAAGLISKAFAAIALPAGLLEALHFQQTHAAADDAANGRTKTLPIGPHGLGVAVNPSDGKNINGYSGGGGSFDIGGKPIAPGYAGFLDPTWTPVAGQSTSDQPHMYRTRDGQLRPVPTPASDVAIPPVSDYVPPVITQAPKGGTPNLPYSGTADPNAYGGTPVYTGGTTSDTHGELVPNAANLKSIIQQQFGITDIGGYRAPDGYNEHSSGQALDIMVGANKALGDQVNQFLLKNAAALGIQYDLWQQTQWNPDGTTSGMSDRGSPTANHRDHVHARVRPGAPASGALSPMDSMYSGVDTGGVTSSDLSLRNAQQRINDTQHTEEQAQGRLNELRAKGTATDRQMEAAEYALAKAKREHQDAIDGLSVAQDKYNKSATQGQGGNSAAQDLGSSFLGGIGQIFGLDGSLFQDPSQFGLFKIFKAAMGLKFDPSKAAPGAGQGTNYGAGLPSSGGGGGGLGGLLSNIPKAFGALQVGSPQAGPGGYMPGMPGGAGNGSLLDAVQFSPTGQPGSPGPGNNPVGYQNAGIDLRGASFGDSQGQLSNQISAINSSQNRYGPMLQNVPG